MITYKQIVDVLTEGCNYSIGEKITKKFNFFHLTSSEIDFVLIKIPTKNFWELKITLLDDHYPSLMVLYKRGGELTDYDDKPVEWDYPTGTWTQIIERLFTDLQSEIQYEKNKLEEENKKAELEQVRIEEDSIRFFTEKYEKLYLSLKQ